MAEEQAQPTGPDLTQGVPLHDFTGDTLLGHVGDESIVLVRSGSEIFAIDAHCSHYHGPLAEGLVVGATVRCPWHHACFDLRTGEATRAPAGGFTFGCGCCRFRRTKIRPASWSTSQTESAFNAGAPD